MEIYIKCIRTLKDVLLSKKKLYAIVYSENGYGVENNIQTYTEMLMFLMNESIYATYKFPIDLLDLNEFIKGKYSIFY